MSGTLRPYGVPGYLSICRRAYDRLVDYILRCVKRRHPGTNFMAEARTRLGFRSPKLRISSTLFPALMPAHETVSAARPSVRRRTGVIENARKQTENLHTEQSAYDDMCKPV